MCATCTEELRDESEPEPEHDQVGEEEPLVTARTVNRAAAAASYPPARLSRKMDDHAPEPAPTPTPTPRATVRTTSENITEEGVPPHRSGFDLLEDVEVLLIICCFLEPKDLGRLARVSRLFGGKIQWRSSEAGTAKESRSVVEESARRWVLGRSWILDAWTLGRKEPAPPEGKSWLRRMHDIGGVEQVLHSATLEPLRTKNPDLSDWMGTVGLLTGDVSLGGELFGMSMGPPGAGLASTMRERAALKEGLQTAVQQHVEYRLCAWAVTLEHKNNQMHLEVAQEMGVSLGTLRHSLAIHCLAIDECATREQAGKNSSAC